MDVTALIAGLAAEGPRIVAAARAAGWDAAVPGLDWDVRAVITHLGGVHRWATMVVSGAPADDVQAAHALVDVGPAAADLVEWFTAGHEALVSALAAAPDDLEAFTFLPAESALHFWARRQAHETAIHRADVERAAGIAADFEDDFAQDGIAELLLGFARRRNLAVERGATLGLDAADGPSWLVTFGGERTEARTTEDLIGTDVTVRGRSSDLYLWLWNRPGEAAVDGDADVAALWGATVQVSWG